MMVRKTVLIILVSLSSTLAFDFGYSTFAAGSIVLEKADDIETICQARKCLRKCCPKDQYIDATNSTFCDSFEGTYDFRNIPVYDDYDHSMKLNKTLSEIFLLLPGKFDEIVGEGDTAAPFSSKAYDLSQSFSMYLTESGKLYLELPNSYSRWNLADDFCIDYMVNGSINFVAYPLIFNTSNIAKSNIYFTVALLVSSVFLFIVLIVYIILPELRNLVGLVLMAYVVSLMGAFLSLASLQLGTFSNETCLNLTAVTYFSFLATFCWMNVMSFDIWWTFRGYAKARPIHRRGEMFKFGTYCVYAWGIPLLMAVGLVLINKADFSDMPWFITPQIPDQGCFLEGGQKLLYLYVPMLILIVCNWMFFLMTAFNVWRLSRGTSVLDSAAAGSPAAHRKQRNRLMVYLKLSVIMGINWVLEVVSFLTPEKKGWLISDAYNLLIGLSIFLIFVCKKKIYRKLQNRYYGYVNAKPKLSKSHTSSSTLESNLSQDVPLQVSTHPMGPNGRSVKKDY